MAQTDEVLKAFDPMVICDSLAQCSADENNTLIDEYLVAYQELNK